MGLPLLTINGINIQMPTDHGWNTPESIGVGARGADIVSGIYSYGLQWEILTPGEFNTIWNIWFNNINTQITASLPEIGASVYQLKTYACYMAPVSHQGFFEGTYLRVRSELTNIDITA